MPLTRSPGGIVGQCPSSEDTTNYWQKQKEACKEFEKDLENAGFRKHTIGPDEFARPSVYPRPTRGSGCSSSSGWD